MQDAECEREAMAVPIRGPTLGEQVYDFIRDKIVNGDFAPGQAIVESELASDLNVSRTPVSNAVIMLKERGLLEDCGGKACVPRLTLKDVSDLYRCRLVLDGLASRLAASVIEDADLEELAAHVKVWEDPAQHDNRALWVADLSFHEIIYRVADNRHLVRFAHITTELAAVYRRSTIRRMDRAEEGGRTPETVWLEHEAILQALQNRDPEAAENAAVEHIRNVIEHLADVEVVGPKAVTGP